MSFPRGVAVNGFPFAMINKDNGTNITTGVVGYITKDDGDDAALINTPVYKGNGQWTVDITAEEMNAVMIGLVFTHTDGITVPFTIRTLDPSDLLAPPDISTPGGLDIEALASAPFRTRTNEGSVQERTVDELIKADRYLQQADVPDAPWGIRFAQAKPGSAV